jgi:hypothetical protein
MEKVTLSFVSQEETVSLSIKKEYAFKIPYVKKAYEFDDGQDYLELNFKSNRQGVDHYYLWLKNGSIFEPTLETILLADFLGDTTYVSLASKEVDWSQYKNLDLKNQHVLCQKYVAEWYLDQCFHTKTPEKDKLIVNYYYPWQDGIVPIKKTVGGKKHEFTSQTCINNFLTIDRKIAEFIWENSDRDKIATYVKISAKRRKGFISSPTLDDLEKYLRRVKQIK